MKRIAMVAALLLALAACGKTATPKPPTPTDNPTAATPTPPAPSTPPAATPQATKADTAKTPSLEDFQQFLAGSCLTFEGNYRRFLQSTNASFDCLGVTVTDSDIKKTDSLVNPIIYTATLAVSVKEGNRYMDKKTEQWKVEFAQKGGKFKLTKIGEGNKNYPIANFANYFP